MKSVMLIVTGVVLLFCASLSEAVTGVPKGYGSWKKSVRKVVTDKNSLFYGSHYIYADTKALSGYLADNRFAEGSRIVVEFFALSDNTKVDGAKNMIVLMQKDKRQTATGGWLFAGFAPDGTPSGLDPVTTCFSCHQKDAARKDFVISTKKDFNL